MSGVAFALAGADLVARGTGALWWPGRRMLCVSDLHLGRSERVARRGGTMLPPYDTRETLARLDAEIDALDPRLVICLGDSFDDLAAAGALGADIGPWIARMQAGRDWIWIEGNHDPGPLDLGGTHRDAITRGGLVFRHIAHSAARGEVSGHFHPKASLGAGGRRVSRPAFVLDDRRVILPAFGAYTGGLRATDPAIRSLLGKGARAILTGATPLEIPLPG